MLPDERRRSRRRNLPYIRSAAVELDGRSHVVVVRDLGPEGAFLETRIAAKPGRQLRVKMVLPRDGREVVIDAEVVRMGDRSEAPVARRAGLAVRFRNVEPLVITRLREFAAAGLAPTSDRPPAEHFEYRVLDRPFVDAAELERLGLDGWDLCTAVPQAGGLRMIFKRRL